MKIHSSNIYTNEGLKDAVLVIENNKIIKIEDYKNQEVDIDYKDLRIIPGIIDTHNHGTMGYTLMGEVEDKENEVRGYLKGLASQGVTGVFPTADHNFFKTIKKISEEEVFGAKVLGIHSEGPYLNRVGEKGVDTGHPEIDLNHIKQMIIDAGGLLKLFGLAPELQGAKEAIKLLNENNIVAAFAHSNDNYEQANEAFSWGIKVSTHTANVMSGIHHRNMGGLGACLLNDDVQNEVICDGFHVANNMLEIMFRVKNDAYDKFMMVSDNVPMAGADEGKYYLAMGKDALIVNIDEEGHCLSDTGRLCGSTVPVIGGIKNLVNNMHKPIEKVLKMASYNPAKFYGLENRGEIKVGNYADFVVIDEDYNPLNTYVDGIKVFDKDKDINLFNKDFLNKYKVN